MLCLTSENPLPVAILERVYNEWCGTRVEEKFVITRMWEDVE